MNVIMNNIIYGYTTGISMGSNYPSVVYADHNNFYNNTTNRTNIAVGANDTALDPQFTDAANGDFSIGTNLKGLGYPSLVSSTPSFVDIGMAQREEPSTQTDLLGVIQ
jgi:hypothetical protein